MTSIGCLLQLGRAVRLFADEDDKGETTAAKVPPAPP